MCCTGILVGKTQLVHRDAKIFIARKRSLGQGNVLHLSISHSVHRGMYPGMLCGGVYPSMQLGQGMCVIPACNWAWVCVSQHAIGQGCVGGCEGGVGEVNFWYNLLLWSSGVPFCYGLLVWPSGWECPSVMTFWCTPLPAP